MLDKKLIPPGRPRISKATNAVKDFLKGEAQSGLLTVAIALGAALLSGFAFAVWAALRGQSGPQVALTGLAAIAVVFVLVGAAQRIQIPARMRTSLRALMVLALLGLSALLVRSLVSLVGEVQEHRNEARTSAPAQVISPVIPESPDHAGLKERLDTAVTERDTHRARATSAEEKLLRAEQRVKDLERQLDNRATKEAARSELGSLYAQGSKIFEAGCLTDPKAAMKDGNRWAADVIAAFKKHKLNPSFETRFRHPSRPNMTRFFAAKTDEQQKCMAAMNTALQALEDLMKDASPQ